MPIFRIIDDISGLDLGTYEAPSAAAALDAMALRSGYQSYAEALEVAPSVVGTVSVLLIDDGTANTR